MKKCSECGSPVGPNGKCTNWMCEGSNERYQAVTLAELLPVIKSKVLAIKKGQLTKELLEEFMYTVKPTNNPVVVKKKLMKFVYYKYREDYTKPLLDFVWLVTTIAVLECKTFKSNGEQVSKDDLLFTDVIRNYMKSDRILTSVDTAVDEVEEALKGMLFNVSSDIKSFVTRWYDEVVKYIRAEEGKEKSDRYRSFT